MNNVELPLVPSARSRGSSANSEASSYYFTSEEPEHLSEENQGEQDEKAPLWEEVETFLNKPSPSLTSLGVDDKDDKHEHKVVLPHLKSSVRSSGNAGKGRKPIGRHPKAGVKEIDPQLLQQAFAYADQIQHLNFDDFSPREETKPGRGASGVQAKSTKSEHPAVPRAPRDESRKTVSRKASAYSSSVRPTANNAKTRRAGKGKDNGPRWGEVEGKNGAGMDTDTMQELIHTLETGAAVSELRAQLEQSKQSLEASRCVLQTAAQTFYTKKE